MSDTCPFCPDKETVFHSDSESVCLLPLFMFLESLFRNMGKIFSKQMLIIGFKYKSQANTIVSLYILHWDNILYAQGCQMFKVLSLSLSLSPSLSLSLCRDRRAGRWWWECCSWCFHLFLPVTFSSGWDLLWPRGFCTCQGKSSKYVHVAVFIFVLCVTSANANRSIVISQDCCDKQISPSAGH